MAYTTTTLVQSALLGDYDGTADLSFFVTQASVMLTNMVTCATKKGITITEDNLQVIETYLAAHYYAIADRILTQKTTGRSAATFAGVFEKGLALTPYGQAAMDLDPSGCLSAMTKRNTIGGFWLGKSPSDQIPYKDRD